MSWNNTVTCSWCYAKGHNRNGCPSRKRYIAENPDSYEASIANQRARKLKNRQCSYCKETGHTKRTCKHLKEDKAKTIAMNREWRKDALKHLKRLGLGIGALVQFESKNHWGDTRTENVMISDILWENLTFFIKLGNNPYSFSVRAMDDFGRAKLMDFPMDTTGRVTRESTHGLFANVLGPVSASSIEATVPEGWITGETGVDQLFVDSRGKVRERYLIDWIEK